MLNAAPVVQPLNPLPAQSPATVWKAKYPAICSGVLAFLQYGMTFIIVGCEIGSVLIDTVTATIYVGFWASLFFISAWVSQSILSCCVRNRPCATCTLINQSIAIAFAVCVIGFDAYFIAQPTACFFPSYICSGSGSTRGVFYSGANFYNVKIPLIILQLVAAVIMIVLCLISIVLYITTAIRVHRATQPSLVYSPVQQYVPPVPEAPPAAPSALEALASVPPLVNIRQARPGSPLYHRPMNPADPTSSHMNDLTCPTCNSTMALTLRQKPLY